MAKGPYLKIIPDLVFHELWDAAFKSSSQHEYLKEFGATQCKTSRKLEKCGISVEFRYTLLSTIYEYAQKPFSQIIKKLALTNAQFSHAYCVPIRTVEDWVSGKGSCPSYVKLFIYRQNGIKYLPAYMVEECRYIPRPEKKEKIKKEAEENASNFAKEIIKPTLSEKHPQKRDSSTITDEEFDQMIASIGKKKNNPAEKSKSESFQDWITAYTKKNL